MTKQVVQEITRTIKIRVDMPLELAKRTIQRYLNACNYLSQVAFDRDCLRNARVLQDITYETLRAEYGLPSQAACSAIREVVGKYRAEASNGKKPQAPLAFRNFSKQYQLDRDFSYTKSGDLSISTDNGRMTFSVGTGSWAERYADWEPGGGVLFIQRGKVYFAQTVSKLKPAVKSGGNVLGVDRGINLIAAATDGHKASFYAGGRTKQRRRYYLKLRASLQQKKAQRNTRSVARLLQRLSGREARFQTDVNHVVSKGIVKMAVETGCDTIATEQLKGIRERANEMGKSMRQMVNAWAFYELQAYIHYKAEAVGVALVEVDPAYTSQRCPRCGHTEKANRSKHSFSCRNPECGYRLHADLIGARNIRERGIAVRPMLDSDGMQVSHP